MVQPKHNPQEALERMKLMMKYDSSKTLNENVETILEQTERQMDEDVETMIDLLDFPVTETNMADALKLLKKYESTPKAKEFLDLYQMSGLGGGSLRKTLNNVWTTSPGPVRKKKEMIDIIDRIENGGATPQPTSTAVVPVPQPTATGNTPSPTPAPKTSQYTNCPDTFPIKKLCKNGTIRQIQGCLGIKADGAFGPQTEAALVAKGLSGTEITQNSVDTVCNNAGGNSTSQDGEIQTDDPTDSTF